MRTLLCIMFLALGCGGPAPAVPSWQTELDALRQAHFEDRQLDSEGRWRLIELLDAHGDPDQADAVQASLDNAQASEQRLLRAWLGGGTFAGEVMGESVTAMGLAELLQHLNPDFDAPGWMGEWVKAARAGDGRSVAGTRIKIAPDDLSARVAMGWSLSVAPITPAERLVLTRNAVGPVIERSPSHPGALRLLARAARAAGLDGVAIEALGRATRTPATQSEIDGLKAAASDSQPDFVPQGAWVGPSPVEWADAFNAWYGLADPGERSAFDADQVILLRRRDAVGAHHIETEIRLARSASAWVRIVDEGEFRTAGKVANGWLLLCTKVVPADAPFFFADPVWPTFRAETTTGPQTPLSPVDGAPSAEPQEGGGLHFLSGPRPPIVHAPFAQPFAQRAPRLARPAPTPNIESRIERTVDLGLSKDGQSLVGTVDGTPASFPIAWIEGEAVVDDVFEIEGGAQLADLVNAARAPDRTARIAVPRQVTGLEVTIHLPAGWRPIGTWDSFELQGPAGTSTQSVTVGDDAIVLRRRTRLVPDLVEPGPDSPFARWAAEVVARAPGTLRLRVAPESK